MLNVHSCVGRVYVDPKENKEGILELKYTKGGKPYVFFKLACNRDEPNASGKYQCDWLEFQAWGKTAEFICNNFRHKDLMGVEGRIQVNTLTAKNGQKYKKVDTKVKSVSFCGGRESANAAQSYQQPSNNAAQSYQRPSNNAAQSYQRPSNNAAQFYQEPVPPGDDDIWGEFDAFENEFN